MPVDLDGARKVLKLVDEIHRGHQLPGQRVADGRGVRGVGFRRAVRVHRYSPSGELDVVETVSKSVDGALHQWAVECRGHLQRRGPPAAIGAGPYCPSDRVSGARQHSLRRAVAVGQHRVDALVGEHRVKFGQGCLHRDHGPAVTRSRRHHLAAERREAPQGIVIHPVAGPQGDQFAVAVAGGAVGSHPESVEDS